MSRAREAGTPTESERELPSTPQQAATDHPKPPAAAQGQAHGSIPTLPASAAPASHDHGPKPEPEPAIHASQVDPPSALHAGPALASPFHAPSLPAPSHPAAIPLPIAATDAAVISLPGVAHEAGLPAESAPLFQRAAEDPGLAVAVLPHAAHLSLVSDGGDLSLHVRVRDGNAAVHVSGSMAPMFESRAPEVRTVLAGQGLGLGSFATDQQGGQQYQQQRGETTPAAPPSPPASPRRHTANPAPGSAIADEGRIHITA